MTIRRCSIWVIAIATRVKFEVEGVGIILFLDDGDAGGVW